MSAFGTKRTCRHAQPMSAFGGKADISWTRVDVGFWHKADVNAAGFVWQGCSKRNRVDCLSCLIVYDQGGVARTIAAVFQFTHDAVRMIFCDLMIW